MPRRAFATPIPPPAAPRRPSRPAAARGPERAAEARLIAAARTGDARALRELVERASGPAWRFSMGFCRDPHDAEDLVQDVMATLLRTLASFRGESALSTWTYIVARRACARRRRRAARAVPLEDARGELERRADPAAGPHRRLERRELAEALERAIAALPEAQREVVVMRDVEGLPAAEVGRVLGLGERAVKSRLHRARLALREALAPFVRGGDAPRAGEHCPDTAGLLSRYLEGELNAQVCARMESHVAGCPSCGGACESLREVLGACRAYGTRRVPAQVRTAVRAAVQRVVDAPPAR